MTYQNIPFTIKKGQSSTTEISPFLTTKHLQNITHQGKNTPELSELLVGSYLLRIPRRDPFHAIVPYFRTSISERTQFST